jgi:DNA-binding NarL/FixJ family response regulator
MRKTRVAVVDRVPLVREAIRAVLAESAQVVLQADSLEDLLSWEGEVDVVVADFGACSGPHRAILQDLRRRWPGVQLVVATPGDEAEYAAAAAALAADGWVPKHRLGTLLPGLLERLVATTAR